MQKKARGREKAPSRRTKGSTAKASLGTGLTIRSLEVFVVVAQAGTMVAAAERLKLSQPAISQMIASLEQSLGVLLFDRGVRPPVLTLQGTALLRHAVTITESVSQFRNTVRLGGAAQLPLLRIGVLNSFATTVGPYVFKELRNIAAAWAINSGFQATRFRTVADRDFDFAITADEVSGAGRRQDRADPERTVFVDCSGIIQCGTRIASKPEQRSRSHPFRARSGLAYPSRPRAGAAGIDRATPLSSRHHRGRACDGCRRLGVDDPAATRCHQAIGARRHYPCTAVSRKTISENDQHRIVEGARQEIADRIRDAAISALTTQFMPHVKRFLPQCARAITIHRPRS